MALNYTDYLYKLNTWDECAPITGAPGEWGARILNFIEGGRYKFLKYLIKGSEAVLLRAWDEDKQKEVLVKIGLPKITDKSSQNPVFYRKKKDLWVKAKDLFLIKFGKKGKGFARETANSLRFSFGLDNQSKAHGYLVSGGHTKYGYIPEVYSIGRAPKVYGVIEFIPGVNLIEYIPGLDDELEKIELFYNMLKLLYHSCHQYAIVHSDLKPDNWLVINKSPVLLDFGISKDLNRTTKLTRMGDGLGSELYASKTQRRAAYLRGFKDDLYTILLTFWCIWNSGEPTGEQIYAEDDEKIFPPSIFPFSLREIYKKGIALEYDDVTLLINDVEEVLNERKNIVHKCLMKKRLETLENKVFEKAKVVGIDDIEIRLKKIETALSLFFGGFENV
jgi:serine/threonine protein kinase